MLYRVLFMLDYLNIIKKKQASYLFLFLIPSILYYIEV